jgi:PAS domain S-box-containing protein
MTGVDQSEAGASWIAEDRTALEDFWSMFDAHHEAVLAETLRSAAGHPELGWLLREASAGRLEASVADGRARLRRAIDGDWAPLDALARETGAAYAKRGVSVAGLHAMTTSISGGLLPHLVGAYHHDPARLLAVVNVLRRLADRRVVVAIEEYLRTVENNARRAEVEAARLRKERDAEAKFRGLLEAAPDPMVIVDDHGRIVLINTQAERCFGYGHDEVLGQPIEMLVPDRFAGDSAARRDDYFRDSKARPMAASLELYARRKDGTEFAVEMSLSPLETVEGTLVTAAIRDITDRKKAEAALQLANRELEAFSYSVAHDLRAPLRGMSGFATMLRDAYRDKLDDEGKDWLEEILLNAKRMSTLIDGLLSLSRVTRSEMKPESLDLSALARSVAGDLRAGDPSRVVELVVADDLRADVDPRLALVLLENLLGNAWKFTSKAPAARVEVGTTGEGEARTFFVRDNGAGFDMAYAANLFAPFRRLHTVAEFPGTGIGLATVQRVVHRHGGRVWADGRVNEGATFYFTLPPSTGEATR